MDKVNEFIILKHNILQCKNCENIFGFKPNPIVHGNLNSKIVQISQAPSYNVHITQRPFNDASGRKLKYKWYKINDEIFYNEDNFYITALSHCFPGKTLKGGDKLPPLSCARMWLQKEISLINNSIYIIIGRKAADFFFPKENYVNLIFQNNRLNEKTAIVIPHPSPLNIKWFKEHPEFERDRLPYIRNKILETLQL